jgi:hypothetical protein
MSLTDNRDDLFKKQVSRRDALKLGGSALLGAGAGLSSLSSPAWASEAEKSATYKFGLVLPMTGSNAAFGLDQVKAALMSVDDINRSKKYGGIKVQAAVEDSQANPRVGVEAFNKVVSVAGVPVVISAWSSVIYALAPLANREKVLLISDGAADAQIAHLGHYVVSAFPLNNVDITALANYLRLELKHKNAGIIYVNNATGQVPTKVFKYVFEKAGGQVVSMQSHEPDATDFTAQLTKLRAAGPSCGAAWEQGKGLMAHGTTLSTIRGAIARMRSMTRPSLPRSLLPQHNPSPGQMGRGTLGYAWGRHVTASRRHSTAPARAPARRGRPPRRRRGRRLQPAAPAAQSDCAPRAAGSWHAPL